MGSSLRAQLPPNNMKAVILLFFLVLINFCSTQDNDLKKEVSDSLISVETKQDVRIQRNARNKVKNQKKNKGKKRKNTVKKNKKKTHKSKKNNKTNLDKEKAE